ncbi:MAG: acyl-CoA dehydratase activase-related protein [Coriobacteriaceae bacterium]|nr:acyl-CoA dehydratase activase-related protein [Coriobacteriaceae bacterium]
MTSADCADIRRIGIPRALLYHRYGVLWETFFEKLGIEVVLSRPTDRAIVERGELLSNDECCLASKVYIGHVASLIEDEGCEAIFTPAVANFGKLERFCTKFQALPDLTANTFRGQARFISCMVEEMIAKTDLAGAFAELAARFGAGKKHAKKIAQAACEAQLQADRTRARAQDKVLKELRKGAGENGSPLSILLVAHPYVAYDSYIGGAVTTAIEASGARLLLACESDHDKCYEASKDFSATMPWRINRELIGAILRTRASISGIVLLSAFPCGPDSMTNDAVMRCISGIPILNLTVDSQSGTAGLETRIESFVDILRYQQTGGYLK